MATLTSASNYLENALLDLVFNGTTYTPPSNPYVALYTAAPTDAGGGTEVGTRQAAAFASASGREATTSADITFTAVTGGANVTHFGIHDAASSGNLLFWGEVDTPVDPGGDDFLIAAGDLTVKFALTGATGISADLGNALLNHVLRSESYSPATTVEVALIDDAGTEVTGGSYARQATSFGAAASGSVANDSAESWSNMPAVTVGSLRAYEDAASGGMALWDWDITDKAYTAGGVATLAVAVLTATID